MWYWSGSSQGQTRSRGQAELFRAALERIRQMPGVDGATEIQSTPFAGHHVPPIGVPGMAESPSVNGQLPFLIAATPEFLRILGIDIAEGRPFTRDDERGAPVVIVNQTMARTVWPGESALGKCIRIGFDPVVRPVHGHRSARPADERAVPRSHRCVPRRPSAIGRARRRRGSPDAVRRSTVAGAGTARGCWSAARSSRIAGSHQRRC